MEKVLDYEQDLGGLKEDPTRPIKAPQGPPGTMIRNIFFFYIWQVTGDKLQMTCDR